MNIIYLVSQATFAGPINQAFNLLTGFNKELVNPILVTLFPENSESSWLSKFTSSGIHVICLNCNRFSLHRAAKKIDKIIAEREIQIVHSSGVSADTVNRLLKSRVIKLTTIRSHIKDVAEKKNFIIKRFTQYRFKKNIMSMNARVACSYALQEDFMKETGLMCECVQNGVDVERYRSVDRDQKMQLRQRLGLPIDKTIYTCVGVFYPRKQIVEMVKAFIELNHNDSILLLVGDGETYELAKHIAESQENVIFVGKKADPVPFYQSSDVFVSASLAEGLPNSVMEAMACGLPCILSDIEPHKEIVNYDLKAGGLFKTGDYDDFKLKMYESFKWDVSMASAHAIELVNKNLSKYATAEHYYSLYTALVEKQMATA